MNAPNSEHGQGRLSRYAAIATIAGALITLFAWLYPRSPSLSNTGPEERAGRERGLESTGTEKPANDESPASGHAGPSPPPIQPPVPTEKPSPGAHPDSIIFSLRNGEQKVFSHGDLTVSGEFTQIGDMVVPTLHLQAKGREPEDHALLTAGGRFEVAVGSKTFVVSVLRVDDSAQTFELQVDLGE